MIATTIAALFSLIAIATALALMDVWLRARSAYASLKRQSALVQAGFVPQVEARVIRLRSGTPRVGGASRPFARRLPRATSAPALDAA